MSEETPQPKYKRWHINWTSDKIMSTSALFISVISLIALLYQSYLAREENELIQKQQSASVLPYLNQWYSNQNGTFKLIFGNKGVGPAFITSVEITLESSQTFDNSDDFFTEIFKNSPTLDTIPYVRSTLIKGLVLPANESINVIEIQGQQNINTFREVFESRNMSFKIEYEDVYGSRWILSDKNESEHVPILVEKE